jgi:hypothetical protein
MHDSVINAENQVPSEIRKNDINLQAQLKPLPIFGLASDLTTTLRNHWSRGRDFLNWNDGHALIFVGITDTAGVFLLDLGRIHVGKIAGYDKIIQPGESRTRCLASHPQLRIRKYSAIPPE